MAMAQIGPSSGLGCTVTAARGMACNGPSAVPTVPKVGETDSPRLLITEMRLEVGAAFDIRDSLSDYLIEGIGEGALVNEKTPFRYVSLVKGSVTLMPRGKPFRLRNKSSVTVAVSYTHLNHGGCIDVEGSGRSARLGTRVLSHLLDKFRSGPGCRRPKHSFLGHAHSGRKRKLVAGSGCLARTTRIRFGRPRRLAHPRWPGVAQARHQLLWRCSGQRHPPARAGPRSHRPAHRQRHIHQRPDCPVASPFRRLSSTTDPRWRPGA